MSRDFHGSNREPDHVVLVRLVTRGLSEGTITLEDIKGLTGREIRALLAERTSVQPPHTAHTFLETEPDRARPEPTAFTAAETTAGERIQRGPKPQPQP